MNSSQINELSEKIEALLPSGLKQVKNDFDSKLKELLSAQLQKLDFVTREEFEIQQKVLLRTRKKLEELEKQLEAFSAEKSAQ